MLPQSNESAAEAPPRRFRKLRIAWSVAWGVAAVLLVVFWVRSYWRVDQVYLFERVTRCTVSMESWIGRMQMQVWIGENQPLTEPRETVDWISRRYFKGNSFTNDSLKWFGWHMEPEYQVVRLPYLIPMVLSAVASISPWFRFRFSLRTLLIATTLVAVGLGLIVWLAR